MSTVPSPGPAARRQIAERAESPAEWLSHNSGPELVAELAGLLAAAERRADAAELALSWLAAQWPADMANRLDAAAAVGGQMAELCTAIAADARAALADAAPESGL